MKKFVLLAAAAAALAGCAKTTISGNTADQAEITYEVAPLTKGLANNQSAFSKDNVFASYAFYLSTGSWNYPDDADFYIGGTVNEGTGAYEGVTVKWNTTASAWKNPDKNYYWPKTGSLTFFSWTLNKANLTFTDANTIINCSSNYGIFCTSYDAKANKNIDFMVADIAKDKKANENIYSYTGVPTLFRHKLSQFQATVCEKEAYTGITFTLKSITFPKSYYTGWYHQKTDTMQGATSSTSQTYYSSTTGQVVNTTTATAVDNAGIDQYIYMPQVFTADNIIEIKYDVAYDTNGDNTPDVTETVTATKKLSEIFGTAWEMGKKYTLNITFSVNEILWDPAVEDWEGESKNVTVI